MTREPVNLEHNPHYASAIRNARERSGRSPEAVAREAGVSLPDYLDLESYDSDVMDAISIRHLGAVLRAIRLDAESLFGPVQRRGHVGASVEGVADALRRHLLQQGYSLETFEDEVGWSVAHLLDEPSQLLDFNVDGLRAVCDALGLDWMPLLSAGARSGPADA